MNTLNIKKVSLFGIKLLLMVCFLSYGTTFSQNVKANAKQEVKNVKNGELTFETDEIDYGTIKQNADGLRVFKFTNTGNAPVLISNVKTSCGCTVPEYSKEPVMPGESGEIKVKYATNRVGAFTKTITVMSNAKNSKKILRIKGNVLRDENPTGER